MSRCIDADELMELLTTAIRNMKGIAKFIGAEDDPEIKMKIKAYTDIANEVKDMPTIEPERNGGWVHRKLIYSDISIATCTICGKRVPVGNFCKNCGSYNGANMEEGEQE